MTTSLVILGLTCFVLLKFIDHLLKKLIAAEKRIEELELQIQISLRHDD